MIARVDRPRRIWLSAGMAGGCLLTAAVVAYTFDAAGPHDRTVAAVGHGVLVLVPVLVGLAALAHNPSDRFGRLLLGAGIFWATTVFASATAPTPYSVGRVANWLVEATILYLLLAFPSGRLSAARDRRLLVGIVVLLAGLYLPTALIAARYPEPSVWLTCGGDCPANAFAVTGSLHPVATAMRAIREPITVALFFAVLGVVGARTAAAGPLLRRALVPVAAVAAIKAIVLPGYLIVRAVDPQAPGVGELLWVYALCPVIVAVGFGLGLVMRQLHASASLQRLALQLRFSASPSELRDAVSDALEDPSVRLLYWRGGREPGWVDEAGRPTVLPRPSARVAVTEVRHDSLHVAALVQDASLAQSPNVSRAALAYALVVLENAQLVDRLETSVGQLVSSRSRLVAIADETRRRIEHDLHDGAQQRLIRLRIDLARQSAGQVGHDDEMATIMAALGEQVEEAIDELRALAHGVYPALLTERGLPEALRAVARSAALPTAVVAVDVGRYPPDVEAAVYFACVEALQNVGKHATGATHVTITLTAGAWLAFEICDDGPGFDARRANGGALLGVRDRLGTVRGQLEVDSVPGAGTCVHGRVPTVGARSPAAISERLDPSARLTQ
jgi:signal transduction histidine kinase